MKLNLNSKCFYLLLVCLCLKSTSLLAQLSYSSYRPIPGEKYIISGWVNEKYDITPLTYTSVIRVSYTDENNSVLGTENFSPSGAIIDNWQRIIGEFRIPDNATSLKISLVNTPFDDILNPPPSNLVVFFDDIRVHPYNGNLKSFVYNPATQRLLAELDENNYATYYDYDREGGLVRVKKETEKGVYTIQETRSSTTKNNND